MQREKQIEEIDEIIDEFLNAHDYDPYVDKWEIFNEDYMAFIEKYTKVRAKMKGGE